MKSEEKLFKSKSKKSKRSSKITEEKNYILTKAIFRFKYPQLNIRGDTDAVFGSIHPLGDVSTSTWTKEAATLVSKILKCKRKRKKPSRFFEKGLSLINKNLKDGDVYNASKEFINAFRLCISKNEKNKYDNKLREECRMVVTELFDKGLSSVLEAAETCESNRLRCEFCLSQCSNDDANEALSCDTCNRCVHSSCVRKIVSNDNSVLSDLWYCRECTVEAFDELKNERNE